MRLGVQKRQNTYKNELQRLKLFRTGVVRLNFTATPYWLKTQYGRKLAKKQTNKLQQNLAT